MIFSGLILFKNEHILFKREVGNYQKLDNGEIKNRTKCAEGMGIQRTVLDSICATSYMIIADYEASHNSNLKRKKNIVLKI